MLVVIPRSPTLPTFLTCTQVSAANWVWVRSSFFGVAQM
ncbi:hypothetical protein FHT07_001710 [Xanthomonas arboricola]|nr:hypothetical protein [Xanthomonas arboricola]